MIKNYEVVEDVIETSMNSQGSAIKENEKHLDSIQGKIDLFKNALQTMWNNELSSGPIKFFTDLGTLIVKAIDRVGLFATSIGSLLAKIGFNGGGLQLFGTSGANNSKIGLTNIFTGALSEKNFNETIQEYIDGFKQMDMSWEQYVNNMTNASPAMTNTLLAMKEHNGEVIVGADAYQIYSQQVQAAGLKAKVAAIGVNLLNAAVNMGIGVLVSWGISLAIGAIDKFIHRTENLREEVREINKAYEDSTKTIQENLDKIEGLGTNLEKEFARLAAGVDENGNNMHLTSDEYARYKEICDTICGINPKLADGYDSSTAAIGRNAGVLSELIELQKEEARIKAQEYTENSNVEKIAKNAIKEFEDANEEVKKHISGANRNGLITLLYDEFDNGEDSYGDRHSVGDDMAKKILETMGISNIDDVLKEFYGTTGIFQYNEFVEAYTDEIYKNADLFPDAIKNWAINYRGATRDLEDAQNGLISTMLQVPKSMEEYDDLDATSKSFITNWIKNSDAFKIDENTTEEQANEMKNQIKSVIESVANGDYYVEFRNNKLTASAILDQMTDLDETKVNWDTYKSGIENLFNAFWNAVGGENNKLGKDGSAIDQDSLLKLLGFDFSEIDKELPVIKSQLANFLGKTENEIDKLVGGLSTTQVKKLIEIDWDVVGTDGINEWQDVLDKVNESIKIDSVKTLAYTYDDLAISIADYKEVLAQVNNIQLDGTEITKDLYDTISEFIGNEEVLSKVIDTSNGYIVKNANALKNLIKYTANSTTANIRLSKSQAMLQYYKLFKQSLPYLSSMINLRKSKTNLTKATAQQINALRDESYEIYDQMSAIEQQISYYDMLEQEILGSIDAFDKFAEAQEFDDKTNYMSNVEGMALALGQAFQSAKLGSKTAQAAIEGLVPESVYENLDTVEEKMQAIYDYFSKDLSQLITIEYDGDGIIQSAEVTKENIVNMVQKGINKKIFSGDTKSFEFSDEFLKKIEDSTDRLQTFADELGITKAAAFALISEFENYDIEWLNGDYSNLFAFLTNNEIESNLYNTIRSMNELDKKFIDGKISIDEYANKYEELSKLFAQNAEDARSNIDQYGEVTKKIDVVNTGLETAKQNLIEAQNSGGDVSPHLKNIETLTNKYKELLVEKAKLDVPTEFSATIAMDLVNNDIELLKKEWKENWPTVNIDDYITVDEEGVAVPITVVDKEMQDKIDEYASLMSEKNTIDYYINVDKDQADQDLSTIITTIGEASKAIDDLSAKSITPDTSAAQTAFDNLNTTLNDIISKSGTTVTIYKNIVSGDGISSEGEVNGTAHARGTAHISGSAHATGNWGLPSAEHNALVGELGTELVRFIARKFI